MRGHPLDGILQAFIGQRETREPARAEAQVVLKDVLGTMREIKFEMSNCFHDIDEGMDEALRASPAQVYGRHSGWNFNGLVWFDSGLFHEQVWCYRIPGKEISAASLGELMSAVNSEFGSE